MRIADRPEFTSKPKPLSFAQDTTVADAVAQMAALNYGSVMVVDADQRLQGVVTERDILKKLVNGGLDSKTTYLKDIMTENPRAAREDDDFRDWLRIMSNERFRRLPIVDEDNKLLAVMTQGDFVSYSWPDLIYKTGEAAKATISRNSQLAIGIAGVMVYTIIMIMVLSSLG
ncbi:MAG: CBS domain-containing protein [Pseudomonadota bacterium]